VACALLQQEADRLLLVYHEKRWPETAARLAVAARPDTREATDPPAASRIRPGSEIPEMRALLALDDQIWELHLDLTREALAIYVDQQLWNPFVDRYLEIVRERPQRAEVRIYFGCALECAEKCGRTDEVAGVLRHVLETHPELRSLSGLKEALAEWNVAHPPGPELAKR
jgi:hypothetical protein